jgi:hypothetical protein
MQNRPFNNPWDYPPTIEEFERRFGNSDTEGDNQSLYFCARR